MSAVTDLKVTLNGATEPGYTLLVKFGSTCVSYQVSVGEPITGITVVHGDTAPDGYVLLDTPSVQSGVEDGTVVKFAIKQGGENADPIVKLGTTTAKDNYLEAGFVKIPTSLNPDDKSARTFLTYTTEEAQRKIVNHDYEVGDRLDVLDRNTWRTASVREVKMIGDIKHIHIHYEGWGIRYDEWHNTSDPRGCLAPLCSKTKGKWTGQGQGPPFSLKDQITEFTEIQTRIHTISESKDPMTSDDADFVTDQNRKFMAKVLSSQVTDIELINLVVSYLKDNVKIVVNALAQPGSVNPVLTKILAAACNGSLTFFQECSKQFSLGDNTEYQFADQSGEAANQLVDVVESFGTAGGFDVITSKLATFVDPEAKEDRPSFVVVAELTRLFAGMRAKLKTSFTNSILERVDFQEVVLTGLRTVTDKELKVFSEDKLNALIADVKKLLLVTKTESEIAEFIENINLDTALRLMTSDVLEKKINGMNKFKDLIKSIRMRDEPETVEVDDEQPGMMMGGMRFMMGGMRGWGEKKKEPKVTAAVFLTAPILIQWIVDRKVVETVLNRQQHEQVIKLSPILLRFMAQEGALKSEHIDLLWSISAGKHEDLVRIVYTAFAELAEDLDKTQLAFLFERICSKPLAEYREFDVSYVTKFTLNAVKATSTQEGKQNWYGCSIFWNMLQDEAAVPLDITNNASASLAELMKDELFATQVPVYVEKCITGIRSNKSVFQCIRLLKFFVNGVWNPQDPARVSGFIFDMDEKFQVLSAIIGSLKYYTDAARKAKGESKAEENAKVIYVGRHEHQGFLKLATEFLRILLLYSPLKMTPTLTDQFWSTLVVGAVDNFDRDLALQWFTNAADDPQNGRCVVDPNGIQYIFGILSKEHKDLNGNAIPITSQFFSCVQSFFGAVNYEAGSISSKKAKYFYVIDHKKIAGIDTLRRFAMVEDDAVRESSRDLLISLYVRLGHETPTEEKKALWEGFVVGYMNDLKSYAEESTSDKLKLRGAVELLSAFLRRVKDDEGINAPLFAVDEEIKAYYQNGRTRTYDAVISAINEDGTYFVSYSDGDKDQNCPEANLLNKDGSIRPPLPVCEHSADAINHPLNVLSESKAYFAQFFDLLDLGGDTALLVWHLLELLPDNLELAEKIAGLVNAADHDWKSILSASSMIKLLYSLQVVYKHLIFDAQQEEVKTPEPYIQYCSMFMKTGGLKHLETVILNTPLEAMLENELSLKCFHFLVAIVTRFLSGTRTGIDGKAALNTFDRTAFITKLVASLHVAVSRESRNDVFSNNLVGVINALAHLIRTLLSQSSGSDVERLTNAMADLSLADNLSQAVATFPEWDNLIFNGMIKNNNERIREEVRSFVSKLCENGVTRNVLLPKLLGHLSSIDTSSTTLHCSDLLDTLSRVLKSGPAEGFDTKQVATSVTSLITNHPMREFTDKDHDQVLTSLFQLAGQLISRAPELKDLCGAEASGNPDTPPSLLETIVDCLFQLPDESYQGNFLPPKCKTHPTRTSAFKALFALCLNHEANTNLVTSLLSKNHVVTHSNGKVLAEWRFTAENKEESGRGAYSGLRNLGCTCYMNSAMQQLFMIPQLRKNILAVTHYDDPDDSKSLIYNMQRLMANLQEGTKQYADPEHFVNIWTDEFGDPINPSKQEDSTGFVNRLIDRFNEHVKNTPYKNCFTEVIGGKLEHQIIGHTSCKHFKTREEDYFALSVEIKNKKTVLESLSAFIEGEVLEGGNAYRCDFCGTKVDVTKRTVIGTLPPTLLLALKRFELDFTTFQSVKINDRLEFPMEIDMYPYTSEALTTPESTARKAATDVLLAKQAADEAAARAAEEAKGGESKSKSSEGKNKGPQTPAPAAEEIEVPVVEKPERPANYYKFKLKGVIVHAGGASSGHYYSYIQERLMHNTEGQIDGNWYCFNDYQVSSFDPAELPTQCFGGAEARGWGGGANGYLLVYERIPLSQLSSSGDGKAQTNAPSAQVIAEARKARFDVPDKIFGNIREQNLTRCRDKNVYDPAYFDYMADTIRNFKTSDDKTPIADVDLNTPSNPQDALTRNVTRFFFVTFARAFNKSRLQDFQTHIPRLFIGNVSSSVWLLNTLRTPGVDWCGDILLECPNGWVRECAAEIIINALRTLTPLEQASYSQLVSPDTPEQKFTPSFDAYMTPLAMSGLAQIDSRGYCVGFADTLRGLYSRVLMKADVWSSYMKIMAFFVSFGPAESSYFTAQNDLFTLIELYLGKHSPTRANQGYFMGGLLASTDVTYLVYVIAYLITNTPFEAMPQSSKEILAPAFFMSFLMEAFNVERAKVIVPMVNKLCFNNADLTNMVVSAMDHGFSLNDGEQCRPYLRVLMGMLQLQDSVAAQRMDSIMTTLCGSLQRHHTYWKFADIFIDFIIRIAKLHPAGKQWLFEHPDQIDFMVGWLRANPVPPTDNNSFEMQRTKKKAKTGAATRLYHGELQFYMATSYFQPHNLNINQKLAALTLIKLGPEASEELDTKDADDSDFANLGRVYQKGDDVDILDDRSMWLHCTVRDVRGNNILIHYVGYKPKYDEWIETSSCRIRPFRTFCTDFKDSND